MLGDPQRSGFYGWWTYPLVVTLTASQIRSVPKKIFEGYDFLVHSIQTISTGIYSVKWGTTSYYFMDDFVRATNIFGTGILVHQFGLLGPDGQWVRRPPRFKESSSILFEFRDDSVAGNTINLAVEGELIDPKIPWD